MNLSTVKLCIQACINTYGGHYGKVKQIFEDETNFGNGHVEGLYGCLNGILFICFKGSHGRADWTDNFKFWQIDVRKMKPYGNLDSDVRVHVGFIEQYKTIRSIIHLIVKQHAKETKIIVTGHSLGGALATLCAVDIQFNFLDKFVECVTFGSPRVGNKAFAESFNKRIPSSFRYVNGQDIVCKVPMPIFGYCHVDQKIQIGKKKFYKLFSIEDHYPNLYQGNLEVKR